MDDGLKGLKQQYMTSQFAPKNQQKVPNRKESSSSSKLSPVISSDEDSVSQSSDPVIDRSLRYDDKGTSSGKLVDTSIHERKSNHSKSAHSRRSPYPKESKSVVSLPSFKHFELKSNLAEDNSGQFVDEMNSQTTSK